MARDRNPVAPLDACDSLALSPISSGDFSVTADSPLVRLPADEGAWASVRVGTILVAPVPWLPEMAVTTVQRDTGGVMVEPCPDATYVGMLFFRPT